MSDDKLLRILDARESRWHQRKRMAAQYGQTLVTITLCLPHGCRTHPDYIALFPALCTQVRNCLGREGIALLEPHFLAGEDGPACLFSAKGEAVAIKRFCVEAEQTLPGGRMLDVDILSATGQPIGRSELGLPPRRCFVCQQPAAVCVSGALHPPEEVLARAQELRQAVIAALPPNPTTV